MISGCSTIVPVKQKFPDVPDNFLKSCVELLKIESADPLLSEVIKSVTQNYTLYHECSLKNTAWIDWYNEQKKTFNKK